MAMLMAGASHVLIPKFEAKSAIEIVEKHDVIALVTVLAKFKDQEAYVGKPAPHVELRTNGDDFIGIGTVPTRGLDLMIGYADQFLASDSSAQSWTGTDDVGFTDEHQLWLIGQESSRIKTRGANGYP
ncbi:hypothetical protein ACJRO7_016868 [Eucalyptus globulus]|uniref:AMP-dependent synthetase/ligase domain-containing protein n=1 Tax=Eucalyptus globulus TaxID=34317 RepID=A0ABD3KPJ7_EUCGL